MAPETDEKYEFCTATRRDLDEIIALLSDDPLGRLREQSMASTRSDYDVAFADIEQSQSNAVLIIKLADKVIGCAQITIIPNLTFRGAKRCQIEGVRVSKEFQGRGLGKLMIQYAIDQAKIRGCKIVQLTSNNTRSDALKFYEKLGFEASHTGFKLYL
ncbi:MAG: GNAT family N-acetyltransferase [bacterium]|nr:GNAT family N-acetyltransferase [bacterium]